MAIVKATKHVSMDAVARILYVDLANVTEDEQKLIDMNVAGGFAVLPKPEPSAKRRANGKARVKNAEEWKTILTPEEWKLFDAKRKAVKNYMDANKYANELLAKRPEQA